MSMASAFETCEQATTDRCRGTVDLAAVSDGSSPDPHALSNWAVTVVQSRDGGGRRAAGAVVPRPGGER